MSFDKPVQRLNRVFPIGLNIRPPTFISGSVKGVLVGVQECESADGLYNLHLNTGAIIPKVNLNKHLRGLNLIALFTGNAVIRVVKTIEDTEQSDPENLKFNTDAMSNKITMLKRQLKDAENEMKDNVSDRTGMKHIIEKAGELGKVVKKIHGYERDDYPRNRGYIPELEDFEEGRVP